MGRGGIECVNGMNKDMNMMIRSGDIGLRSLAIDVSEKEEE